TKGHYVTKVLGFNWVTIVGADTDVYLSFQTQLNHGVRINLNFSKWLIKTPEAGDHVARWKQMCADFKTTRGVVRQKASDYAHKTGSALWTSGKFLWKGPQFVGKCGKYTWDGTKAAWTFSGNQVTKAGKVIHKAYTDVKDTLKNINFKS